MQAMEAPLGEGQLQQADEAVEGVVHRHHAPKIPEAEQGPKDGVVGGVQEEASQQPDYQGHHLHVPDEEVRIAGLLMACVQMQTARAPT